MPLLFLENVQVICTNWLEKHWILMCLPRLFLLINIELSKVYLPLDCVRKPYMRLRPHGHTLIEDIVFKHVKCKLLIFFYSIPYKKQGTQIN